MTRRKQKGGAAVPGIDISGVAAFNPNTIKGLALWIQPNPALITMMTIADYANSQSPLIRSALIKTFGANLQRQVITELKSNATDTPNSLIPLEVDTAISTRFPERIERPGESPAIDISCYVHPITREQCKTTLVTKSTIELPPDATYMVRGKGIRFDYNEILDRLLVTATQVDPAPRGTQDASGTLVLEPSALLQELLVYARPLSKGERELIEGYFAYVTNAQYTLPEGHPYLPDALSDPSIRELAEPLRTLEDSLRITTGSLNTAVTKARTQSAGAPLLVQEAGIRGNLMDAREALRLLGRTISKGVLAARGAAKGGTPTVDQVITAIGTASLAPAPFTRETVNVTLAAGQTVKTATETYIRDLTGSSDAIAAETVATMNRQTIDLARKEAATEELLGTTEAQVQRREHLSVLATQAEAVKGLGTSLLRERLANFVRELDLTKEAFSYQAKRRGEAIAAATTAAATAIAGTFPPELTFLSQDRDAAGKFKEPLLATLAEKMAAIRTGLQEGDVPRLAARLDSLLAEATEAVATWSTQPILSIFPDIYLQHLKIRFAESVRLDTTLTSRLKEIQEDAETLGKEIEHLVTYQTVVPAPLSAATAAAEPEATYFAALTPADAQILRATAVQTDVSGAPLLQATPLGELDLVLSFTAPPPAVPRLTTSILSQFPPERFPAPQEVDLIAGQTVELSREMVGRLVRLKTPATGLVPPVTLPKYAVPAGGAVVLQNLGPQPLWARNPGAVEDGIDLIGPGETVVYLYGGQDALQSPGFAYGRCPWIEGYLPYDVLGGHPRSMTCTYHEIMKTFLYLDPASGSPPTKFLRDADGNCIEARRSVDGCVYDADDYANSRPYTLRSIPMPPALAAEPVTLVPSAQHTLVTTDATTGLAVLCTAAGTPAAGEFGLLKVCQTPIVWLPGEWKCKGADGDIRLKAVNGPATPLGPTGLRYPVGLAFDRLFRSRFFRMAGGVPVFSTSQGLPLGSPIGALIRVPKDSSRVLELLTYKDPNGTKQAFLIKDIDLSGASIQDIPYMDLGATIATQKSLGSARMILYRYRSSVAYARAAAEGLVAKGNAIKALGEAMTESIRRTVHETKVMIEERATAFDELAVTIQGIERAIAAGSIPNDVQISLGILDVSLRDKAAQITELLGAIQEPVKAYMLLVESSTRLKGFVARLRTDATEMFRKGYTLIQRIQAAQLRRTGDLSHPEVDAVAARLRSSEQGILGRQATLEAAAAKTYEFVSELRDGLLDLQAMCGQQFEALAAAKGLLTTTLPRLLTAAEKDAAREAKETLEALAAQHRGIVTSLMRWVALVGAPGPQNIIRDDPAEPGPFAHMTMPSVERDIRPLAAALGATADLATQWSTMVDTFLAQRELVESTYRQVSAARPPVLVEKETAEAGSAAVAMAESLLVAAKQSLESVQAAMKGPMNTYTALAKALMEEAKASADKITSAATAALQDARDQRTAFDTLYRGVEPILTDDERARIVTIRAGIDGLGLEAIVAPSLAPSTNPVQTAAAITTLRSSAAKIQEIVAAMTQQLNSFATLRAEVSQRLQGVVGAALGSLQVTVDRLRAQGQLTPAVEGSAQALKARPYGTLAEAVDLLADLRTLQNSLDASPQP